MNGLLLIDKPAGMTSFDVVRTVRRLAGTRKVGHTGTLDPDATGLLPVAIGQCTKLSNFLVLDRKEYLFEMQLGMATDTDDASGTPIRECPWEHVTESALDAALEGFRGPIMQVPPIYSALKIDGRRAYDLARRGEEVELAARPVEVYELEVLECAFPRIALRAQCSSGTYVRSLARDLGEALGSCAHTTRIHRTQVGSFRIERAVPLAELTPENVAAAVLTPLEMLASLPVYVASEEQCRALGFGQRIVGALDLAPGATVAVASPGGELVAVVDVEAVLGEGQVRLKPRRVLHAA